MDVQIVERIANFEMLSVLKMKFKELIQAMEM